MQSKGQLLTTEFLFGTTIFCLLLVLLIISFNDISSVINARSNSKSDFDFAFNASDFLVLTPGMPNNWNNLNIDEIHHIGLTNTKNTIDPEKLNDFIDLNAEYLETKEKLGLAQYNVHIAFINNQDSNTLYEFGVLPNNTASITAITRYAVLNSNIIKVNLKVWK